MHQLPRFLNVLCRERNEDFWPQYYQTYYTVYVCVQLSKGMTYWARLGAWPTNVAYVLQAVSKPKDTGTLGGYLHGKKLETYKSTDSALQ